MVVDLVINCQHATLSIHIYKCLYVLLYMEYIRIELMCMQYIL
jgi:hypothetical protein